MRPTIGLRMYGLRMPIALPIARHIEFLCTFCLLVHHRAKVVLNYNSYLRYAVFSIGQL